jgi:1-acyl-sn-glycerol-3-phosphate acyltransferase
VSTVVIRPSTLQSLARTAAGRAAARRVVRRFRAELHGADRVPREGGALLVGNHALFGLDSVALTALLTVEVGRLPRWLGERNLWRLPGARPLLDAIGAVPGTQDAAVRLLRAGELVAVYPGGVDDSFKPTTEAYTLAWGRRAGFAKVALRAGVPIVPIAATGVDELFTVRRHEHVVGRFLFGSARYDLPLPDNLLPRGVPLHYHALPPIPPEGDADDAAAVERLRATTFDALESVLGPYRDARRASLR